MAKETPFINHYVLMLGEGERRVRPALGTEGREGRFVPQPSLPGLEEAEVDVLSGGVSAVFAAGEVRFQIPHIQTKRQGEQVSIALLRIFDQSMDLRALRWVVHYRGSERLPIMLLGALIGYGERLRQEDGGITLVLRRHGVFPESMMLRASEFLSVVVRGDAVRGDGATLAQ